MGKTGKWIKNFLGGKREKERERTSSANKNIPRGTENPATTPILTPPSSAKEKRRWSFRRSSATAPVQKEPSSDANAAARPAENETDHEQEKVEMAVVATDGGSVSSSPVKKLEVSAANSRRGSAIEEFAAVKIQSVFRAYLARKALCALRGLVKLQALVRGHLVRKQATATLRCMQALVTAQARARAQRIKITEGDSFLQNPLWQLEHTKAYYDLEENIKIVEMDFGEYRGNTKSRNSYSNSKPSVAERQEQQHRYSTYSAPPRPQSRQDRRDVSPAPSALTESSPRASSNHFEDYASGTAQSTPHYYSAMSKIDHSNFPYPYPYPGEEGTEKGSVDYAESLNYDYTLCPSYMANTQSSRAKARSQSAPKTRPEAFERQPSRRRASLEGRNVPRAVRMQRSSSHVGATAQNYQYPWSVRLDKSSASLKDSECGSTSTVLTSTQYCRSLVGFDVRGGRY